MFRVIGISAALLLLSGCLFMVPKYDRQQAPDLYSALDSAPQGTAGQIDSTTGFVILGTRASSTLLCRTVLIHNAEGDGKRDYCKIRGGEWK